MFLGVTWLDWNVEARGTLDNRNPDRSYILHDRRSSVNEMNLLLIEVARKPVRFDKI